MKKPTSNKTRASARTSARRWLAAGAAVTLSVFALGYSLRSEATEIMAISDLTDHTHVHGLAVDRNDPARLLIATHHGLFRTRPDGKAERISAVQDFMGFNPHPSDPNTLYASGHPPQGGNLGFIASTDAGATWKQISPGVKGPVDFHQMTVSRADPNRIYGSYGGLQVSRDAGKAWTLVGPAPDGLIDLGSSAKDPDTVYAGTENGLLVSTDAGRSWNPLLKGEPVTLVEVAPDGTLYAFVLGRGLVKSGEPPAALQTVSNSFGEDVLLHLAVDPTDPKRLFAATGKGKLLASTDQGQTWAPLGGSQS